MVDISEFYRITEPTRFHYLKFQKKKKNNNNNKKERPKPSPFKIKQWKMKVRHFLSIFNTVSLRNNLRTLVSSYALQNPLCFTMWNPNSPIWGRLQEGTSENVTRLKNIPSREFLTSTNVQSLQRFLHQWDPKMEAKWLGLNDLSMKIVIIDTLTIYRTLYIMEVTQTFMNDWQLTNYNLL